MPRPPVIDVEEQRGPRPVVLPTGVITASHVPVEHSALVAPTPRAIPPVPPKRPPSVTIEEPVTVDGIVNIDEIRNLGRVLSSSSDEEDSS